MTSTTIGGITENALYTAKAALFSGRYYYIYAAETGTTVAALRSLPTVRDTLVVDSLARLRIAIDYDPATVTVIH